MKGLIGTLRTAAIGLTALLLAQPLHAQTPDDIYYTPTRKQQERTKAESKAYAQATACYLSSTAALGASAYLAVRSATELNQGKRVGYMVGASATALAGVVLLVKGVSITINTKYGPPKTASILLAPNGIAFSYKF